MAKYIFIIVLLLISLAVVPSFAGQMKVFVAEMNVVGPQSRDEMKSALRTMLASRLNGEKILSVGGEIGADIVVNSTYVAIGKVFSIEAIANTPDGKTAARAFVQGDSQDELIPAVGKLADKLTAELLRSNHVAQPVDALRPSADIVKSQSQDFTGASGWMSDRLTGAANLMAVGRVMLGGEREIFLAEGRKLSYYRQGIVMKHVAEAEFRPADKIISLDTIKGSDGSIDVYVTIIRSGELASELWQVKGDALVRVLDRLPYFFRSVGLADGQIKLYAQSMGRNEDFYGDVAEITRTGSAILQKKNIKLPRYGNIYSFTQLSDRSGKTFTIILNPDGILNVYDQDMKEIWSSNEKFGGSELFFQREDNSANFKVTGDSVRWVFMNQRIQISSKGEILVGKNDGFWVLGNARSYKHGAVYCLAWNGSSLEEKWRTRETSNYMPDYYYDKTRNELLILQVVQRPGVFSDGASALSIKKVE